MIHTEKSAATPARYIAIEGPIGVGKTSLCKRLATTFGYDLLLEKSDENPFLDRFYQNRKQHALPTQLFFLLQRAEQLRGMGQADTANPATIADFLLDKDQLFAKQTLDSEEYSLYLNIYKRLNLKAPSPDLVIYLQAPTDVLLERIQKRGILSEQYIHRSYLEKLNEAYTEFFHYYKQSSLLIVNSSEIDLVNNEGDYQQMVEYIVGLPSGTHYFNPKPNFI